MKNKTKIALLGGDLRQYTAASVLCRGNWEINVWGLSPSCRDDGINFCSTYEEAVSDAKAIVLPLPASVDGSYLNCSFADSDKHIRLSDLLAAAQVCRVIVGGKIPAEFAANAEAKGIKVADYFESEEFQIENAYTTAEAALSIAMNSLNRNLSTSRVAVCGYGRISKHLVRLLCALRADVTVAARKESDLAWASSLGCKTLSIAEGATPGILSLCRGYDVIYNTVPHWIFGRDFLEKVDKNTFLIDLASVPGGVDICAAKELSSNVLWATSLPGKYAPISAGELIASCVATILSEEVRAE